MQVQEFDIDGPLLLTGRRFHDERGFFSETYNQKVFEDLGIPKFVQDNMSLSAKGVFRGMHWQIPPHAQGKLVTCLQGAIRDFALDIRVGSPTFGQTLEVHLDSTELKSFWVPPGFAHGFESLESNTLVHYKVTDFWQISSERSTSFQSVRAYFDRSPILVSEKDANAPTLEHLQSQQPSSLF